jgi:hypothetical protein
MDTEVLQQYSASVFMVTEVLEQYSASVFMVTEVLEQYSASVFMVTEVLQEHIASVIIDFTRKVGSIVFETLVTIYQTTQSHIPENHNLTVRCCFHCHQNLCSYFKNLAVTINLERNFVILSANNEWCM